MGDENYISCWKVSPNKELGPVNSNILISCFLIPKSIEMVINKFWWSSGGGWNKGINWLSWSATSMSKSRGGLGFRDMCGCNIALLGKHVWRCIHRPSMLNS